MVDEAFRDWAVACPRRYDLAVSGSTTALAVPNTPAVRRVQQAHDWRTEWATVDASPLPPAEGDEEVVHVPDWRALPSGYYCVRCLAHVRLTPEGGRMIDRYFGDPEEMRAMAAEMARRMQQQAAEEDE